MENFSIQNVGNKFEQIEHFFDKNKSFWLKVAGVLLVVLGVFFLQKGLNDISSLQGLNASIIEIEDTKINIQKNSEIEVWNIIER